MPSLGLWDWSIVTLYVGGLVALGFKATRRNVAPLDFFLASRATRWPVLGLALLASNMSSTALVGLAGGSYALGISVYDYEWSATVILVFFCLFLLPAVIASGTFTMPEFLERRYDKTVRILFALMTLFLNVIVDSAGILYSGSLVCRLLVPTCPLWIIVLGLAGAAAAYAASGGLRAVIYTEAVQGVVLLVGALVISIGAFSRAGGWHAVMSGVDPSMISLIRPIHDASVPWPGLLLGIPLLGFYYWCTNQSIVQRTLSAENLEHARWGALFAGLLKLPVLFLIVLPGTCALLLFPHLARPDLVYPKLMFELLPAGFVGLVVSAFIAATMVAIASILNSASTLITMDVIRQINPALSNSATVRAGRWSTLGLFVVAVLWAPQLNRFPSLWQYLQTVLAYAVPPIVAVFLGGMFWPRANAAGARAVIVIGSCCGLLLFVVNAVLGWTHLHFLYAAPLLTAIDLVLLIGVSGRAAKPLASKAWTRTLVATDMHRPFWQDYRFLASGLLLLTAGLVFWFR